MRPFIAIIRHDWLVARARGFSSLLSLMFFITIAALFPLSSDLNPQLLPKMGVSVLWMAMLLSLLLASDRLFAEPARHGTLDLWLKADILTEFVIVAKLIALFVLHLAPLLLTVPLVALWYHLPVPIIGNTMAALLLASPTLLAVVAFGACLSLHARRPAAINALITLPLTSPLIIFGASSSMSVQHDGFLWLTVLLCLLLAPLIWMSARILEDHHQ